MIGINATPTCAASSRQLLKADATIQAHSNGQLMMYSAHCMLLVADGWAMRRKGHRHADADAIMFFAGDDSAREDQEVAIRRAGAVCAAMDRRPEAAAGPRAMRPVKQIAGV